MAMGAKLQWHKIRSLKRTRDNTYSIKNLRLISMLCLVVLLTLTWPSLLLLLFAHLDRVVSSSQLILEHLQTLPQTLLPTYL